MVWFLKPLKDKGIHVLNIIRQNQFPNDDKQSYEKLERQKWVSEVKMYSIFSWKIQSMSDTQKEALKSVNVL